MKKEMLLKLLELPSSSPLLKEIQAADPETEYSWNGITHVLTDQEMQWLYNGGDGRRYFDIVEEE